MKLLFVCASNICRSPYCEFVFGRMVRNDPELSGRVEVSSAAVFNQMKEMDPKTRQSLLREGFSEEELDRFKPRLWYHAIPDFKAADTIVGMTKLQKAMTPLPFRKKYTTLAEAADGSYHTIPDPYFLTDQEEYNARMDVIKGYLERYFQRIKENLS